MQLTVKDVAGLLDVSEKTVYRWIDDGKLPGYRISGQYRFNKAELLAWATANRIHVSAAIYDEPLDEASEMPALEEMLKSGGVHYRVSGTDVPSALRCAAGLLHLPPEVNREFLLQVLLAREALASTGVGDGIAIPHLRNPVVLHLPKPMVSLCFLERPIDYRSLDGKPVHALFLVVSPGVRAHLQLLARLAFALRQPEFSQLIRMQANRELILEGVRKVEATIPIRARAERISAAGVAGSRTPAKARSNKALEEVPRR